MARGSRTGPKLEAGKTRFWKLSKKIHQNSTHIYNFFFPSLIPPRSSSLFLSCFSFFFLHTILLFSNDHLLNHYPFLSPTHPPSPLSLPHHNACSSSNGFYPPPPPFLSLPHPLRQRDGRLRRCFDPGPERAVKDAEVKPNFYFHFHGVGGWGWGWGLP